MKWLRPWALWSVDKQWYWDENETKRIQNVVSTSPSGRPRGESLVTSTSHRRCRDVDIVSFFVSLCFEAMGIVKRGRAMAQKPVQMRNAESSVGTIHKEDWYISCSIDRSINRSIDCSINRSFDRSTDQTNDQSIDHLIIRRFIHCLIACFVTSLSWG